MRLRAAAALVALLAVSLLDYADGDTSSTFRFDGTAPRPRRALSAYTSNAYVTEQVRYEHGLSH